MWLPETGRASGMDQKRRADRRRWISILLSHRWKSSAVVRSQFNCHRSHQRRHKMRRNRATFISTPPWEFQPAGIRRHEDLFRRSRSRRQTVETGLRNLHVTGRAGIHRPSGPLSEGRRPGDEPHWSRGVANPSGAPVHPWTYRIPPPILGLVYLRMTAYSGVIRSRP